MALYNFDGTLFDGLALPDQLDRDIMISTILIETSNMSVIDPSLPIMKESIRVWSQSKLRAWQKQATVLYENYDPFVNIKRDELRVITQDRDLKGTNTGKVSVKAWDASDMTDRQTNDISSTDTGKITTVVSEGAVSGEEACLFLMKDGDDLMMLGTTNGFITALDDISFQPGSAITWNATISADTWTFMKETT